VQQFRAPEAIIMAAAPAKSQRFAQNLGRQGPLFFDSLKNTGFQIKALR
jgi:hypothetical protein